MLNIIQDGNARTTDTDPSSWILEWTCRAPLQAGTEVELRGANLRTLIAARWSGFTCDHETVEITWHVPEQMSFNDIAVHNRTHALARFRFSETLAPGTTVRLTVTAKLRSVAGGEFPIHLALRKAEHGDVLAGPVVLAMSAGPVRRLVIWARPAPETDGSVRVVLCPVDGNGFPTVFRRQVPVSLESNGQSLWNGTMEQPTTLSIALANDTDILRLTARIESAALADEDELGHATADGLDLLVVSNPIWQKPSQARLPLFGEIHWHTNISGDGMRNIRAALEAARDLLNLDFVAPGDHDTRGPDWTKTVAALESFNADGAFATFFGWEASSDQGHENVYFTDPQHPLVYGGSAGYTGGTDNHCGWPSFIDSRAASNIYTGVWATARTRGAVFDAHVARHTWACWDTRAIVWFTVNDVLQGGELTLTRTQPLSASIRLSVEAPLDLLEIVSPGDAAIAVDVAGMGLDIETRVSLGDVSADTYFYLRALQRDGALIYASPVFVRFTSSG